MANMNNFGGYLPTTKTSMLTATAKILVSDMDILNTDNAASYAFSVWHYDASAGVELPKMLNTGIPPGTPLQFITKIVMDVGDELRMWSNQADTLVCNGAYLVL